MATKANTPKPTKEEKLQAKRDAKLLRERAAEHFALALDSWSTFVKKRHDAIREMEQAYFNNVRPTLKGRSNFPFPVMPKYVDELKGRLDDLPSLRVDAQGQWSKIIIAKKIQAAIDKLKRPTAGDWARKDRMGRTFSIFSGYCAFDFYTEVNEKGFQGVARPVDHNDFVFDPYGGADLEGHRFLGEFPILRTESEMNDRVELGLYDKSEVKRLSRQADNTTIDKNDKALRSRYERYKALGIDIANMKAGGEKIFALAQMQGSFEGKRWMITFDYQTKIVVRFEPLADVFPSSGGMYSYDLYQTHEDPNVVMCKAPVDDIYAVAEAMRLKVNQLMDASTKQLWGMKGYDPNFFPDPSELEWRRPDQLVRMRAYNGKPLSQGVYSFDTKFDFAGNVEFVKYLDGFLASVVGINPNEVSEETKRVGVLFGQLQKTAARLGVQNKSYAEMWMRGIQKILHGMKDNMDEPMMVKMIGSRGAEWSKFTKDELGDPEDFDIFVESGSVEAEMNEALKKTQADILKALTSDPDLKKQVSPKWIVEKMLKTGRWDDEELRRAMDTKNYGNEESISRADAAIEQILKKKKPKPYVGADTAFMSYILDFADKLDDSDEYGAEERIAIMAYGLEHKDIVVKNMTMKAMEAKLSGGTTLDSILPPGADAPPPQPDPVAPPMPTDAPIGPSNAIPTPPIPPPPPAPIQAPLPAPNLPTA